MTALEIRLAIYGFVLAAIAGLLLYGNYERERANGIVAKQTNADLRQKAQDLQLAQDTINALRQQLGALSGTAPAVVSQPPPRIRVCVPTGNVRPEVAASGAQPAGAPNAASDQRLPGVDRGSVSGQGTDIGGGVQDLALAGVLLATYRGQLWDWSVKQAASLPPK